jgi:uncharacterized protein
MRASPRPWSRRGHAGIWRLLPRLLLLANLSLLDAGCDRHGPHERAAIAALMRQRTEKDAELRAESGPLLPEQRMRFQGLAYYPPRLDLVFEVTLESSAQPDTLHFVTSQNTYDRFVRLGVFRFEFGGRERTLTLFQSVENGGLFLPFTDLTSGDTTYGAGRYLNPEPLGNRRYRLDFNRAYNPYCAYNARWICPVPPPENHLDLRIEAGERNFPYKTG